MTSWVSVRDAFPLVEIWPYVGVFEHLFSFPFHSLLHGESTPKGCPRRTQQLTGSNRKAIALSSQREIHSQFLPTPIMSIIRGVIALSLIPGYCLVRFSYQIMCSVYV